MTSNNSNPSSSLDKKYMQLLDEVKNKPNHRNYYYAYMKIKQLDLSRIKIHQKSRIKIALFSSYTIDLLAMYLDINSRLLGLFPEIYIGPFNQYQQEVLNPNSTLYQFNPDLILFNIHAESMHTPDFQVQFPRLSNEEKHIELNSILNSIFDLLDVLQQKIQSIVLFSNFITPLNSPLGIVDPKTEIGYFEFFKELNTKLSRKYQENKQINIFDIDKVASGFGKNRLFNYPMNYRGSIMFNDPFFKELAYEYEGYIKALKNLNRKCIVLDLDNTLWGGIIGEDGIDGIKLDHNYPGNEFVDFQKLILTYYNRGIILAINSKNNYEDAIEVFQKHPAMILKEEHFASMQINWKDKVENIVYIAEELNIGIDSLVFIDDNPVERERVKQALPDVLVVEMPANPAYYRQTLERINDFNTFSLTKEDLKRGAMYVARRKREDLKINISSMEDFIGSLEISAEIKLATSYSIPRIASLINRTNQFNLTTRRYTEAEINDLSKLPDTIRIYSLKVVDKFGDEGIVGVAMVKKISENSWEIDNFLMSCRVIGRKIETVLLNKIIKDAKESSIDLLIGEYIKSKKNKLVKDFFKSLGFTQIDDHNGSTKWKLELGNIEANFPKFIQVIEDEQ
ncbi:MAG: HAD-IIIC family phosphatase [Candidatus Kariarchaeaceae archaeon]|jgi:FkbH-like protein